MSKQTLDIFYYTSAFFTFFSSSTPSSTWLSVSSASVNHKDIFTNPAPSQSYSRATYRTSTPTESHLNPSCLQTDNLVSMLFIQDMAEFSEIQIALPSCCRLPCALATWVETGLYRAVCFCHLTSTRELYNWRMSRVIYTSLSYSPTDGRHWGGKGSYLGFIPPRGLICVFLKEKQMEESERGQAKNERESQPNNSKKNYCKP